MHRLLDSQIVERYTQDEARWGQELNALATAEKSREWAQGSVADWATDSLEAARLLYCQPECGLVSLGPLYDYLRSNLDPKGLELGSPVRRGYSLTAKWISSEIASVQGSYLWGRYENSGLWRNIYLGKAGFGKTAHLRARILEELKDERTSLWRVFVSEEALTEAGKLNHPRMWRTYQSHMARMLKKGGTTHIAWVADTELPNPAVKDVESDLIETLNPRANVSRPVPPVALQKHTKEIIGELRSLIHAHRNDRFPIAEVEPQ